MTLSLNLNGYVKSTDSPIYVEALARFAQPVSFTEKRLSYVENSPCVMPLMQGGLFAGDSPYFLWLVPTIGHSICVSIINLVYSKVAEKCTDLENHRLATIVL